MKQLELFELTHLSNSSDVPNNNLTDGVATVRFQYALANIWGKKHQRP